LANPTVSTAWVLVTLEVTSPSEVSNSPPMEVDDDKGMEGLDPRLVGALFQMLEDTGSEEGS